MLRHLPRKGAAPALAMLALVWAGAAHAQSDEPDDSLRMPEQLTVGSSGSDQFLGQLTPDGKQLYHVSNRAIASEVLSLEVASGRDTAPFEEGAETTWPRVSPDGVHLLYVSFRDRAVAQLCVRDLPSGEHRHCLDDPGEAVQAEWASPARIVLVSRTSIQGDLHVLEVSVGKSLTARPLLEKNLASLALSPDGRWLIYVPWERYSEQVGSGFAARAAPRLEAVRLDQQGPPRPLSLDLPGLTGQPAFSRDGRFLYVTQFFDDSNVDGVIDSSDNGVLFRVPFEGERDDAPARAAAAFPEQLTDGHRNCQYPMPAAKELVATCARRGGLDVYSLPLDGMVPPDWTPQRLREETDLANRKEEQLLLYRHILAKDPDETNRRRAILRLVFLHLELEQYAAAGLYAKKLGALDDPKQPGLSMSRPLQALVAYRLERRNRGRAGSDFTEQARRLLAEMAPGSGDIRGGLALKHLVRSEIADDLGDKDLARQELEAIDVSQHKSAVVFYAYYLRADALYRELDDREALVLTLRRMAEREPLPVEDRLDYARAAVRAMCRGLPLDEADARLERERAGVSADSELGFALELGRAVLAIRDDQPSKEVRQALSDLYKRQTRPDRRRALVLDASQRGDDLGAEKIVEGLSSLWLADMPAGSVERRGAVRLFRRAIQGRAYRRLDKGRFDKALEDFDAVATSTGSYDCLIESLALRLRAGASVAQLVAEHEQKGASKSADAPAEHEKKGANKSADALAHFTRAALYAHGLPSLHGEAHSKAVDLAINELRSAWSELHKNRVAQALRGAIMHQRFIDAGDVAAAQRASRHYLVALEQMRSTPRYRALLLGQLGMLHEEVGNWRIALGYLDEREKLPYLDDETSLAVRLSRARVLLHVDREEQAAAAADVALKAVEGSSRLSAYRLLALDRAALCNLAAGRFVRASALYDQELPLLEALPGPAGARNRLVARLARAAAAMGAGEPQRAVVDLDDVDRGLADPALMETLRWPHATPEMTLLSYRIIASGLRAKAHGALGQHEQAEHALTVRLSLFRDRLGVTNRDEDARALALAGTQLADAARQRGDQVAAGPFIGEALKSADAMVGRTRVTVDRDLLDVLWFAAELRSTTGAQLPFDLTRRLEEAYQATVTMKNPGLRSYQRWFEVYLALTAEAGKGTPAAAVAEDAKGGAPR